MALTTDGGLGESGKPGRGKRRFWLRALVVALVLGIGLYWFRAPILRSIAAYLVVEDMPATADYVLIMPDADGRYDRAARLYHAGAIRGVLLVERYPLRLERLGYCISFELYSQRELAARGVPATAITVIPGQRRTDWERARGLRDWLEQHPTVQILALCDRYGGRKFRYVLDSVLGAEVARRIRVLSLPERDYDETNWWQQRIAVVHIFDAYVNLAYTRLLGEETEEWREWDPDQFKKSLR